MPLPLIASIGLGLLGAGRSIAKTAGERKRIKEAYPQQIANAWTGKPWEAAKMPTIGEGVMDALGSGALGALAGMHGSDMLKGIGGAGSAMAGSASPSLGVDYDFSKGSRFMEPSGSDYYKMLLGVK
jgi:hypothetical protein